MSTADENFFGSFMDDYFAECDEHLTNIRRILLTLDASPDRAMVDSATLEELFRSFHSIKGISGMVELREAETLAHQMESYLRVLRQQDAQLTGEGVDALIAGVDALEATIAARREGTPMPASDAVVAQLATVSAETSPAAADTAVSQAPTPSFRVTFVPSAELVARGINVDSVRARLRASATILEAAPKVLADGIAFEFIVGGDVDGATLEAWRAEELQVERIEPRILPPPAAPAEALSRAVQPSHVVRVDLTRLDDLMRMIGDLVITRARLDESLRRVSHHVPAVEWRAAQENALTMERQLRDLREGVVRVRLVSVGEIFRRMPFVVRDLARDSDKRVRLELQGQDTEIDKFLIERMLDPVLHLVRNAVSHGFETVSERIAAGKPPEGTLRLSAAGVGESVVIEIADDGRGIDAAQIRARAVEAGLTVPPGPLDSATVLDLICAPGFSTRDESDRASGRGVGMAVVKRTVEELNGTLRLQSTPGEGTRFIIELPLTLSIAEALIAEVGGRTFAVPQSSVREVVEVDPATLRQVEQHEIAPFRGRMLPIVKLARVFGIATQERPRLHAFVVGSGHDAVGVAVDRIVGQREIVVRAIADQLARVEGVVGATDLGDGRVVLIIDPGVVARRGRGAAAAVGTL
jgi:two-component system, chemotaxis family, sensor kinase CheA